jgi:hypothetical protein
VIGPTCLNLEPIEERALEQQSELIKIQPRSLRGDLKSHITINNDISYEMMKIIADKNNFEYEEHKLNETIQRAN